jgi:MoaE-MoaD fusion protein
VPRNLIETKPARNQSVTMTGVRIRVLFFGVLKDIVGQREESLEIPDGALLETVFEHYAARFPRLREASSSIVLALNQQFSSPSAALSEGDEVAFLPPVSGGSGKYTHEIADPAGHFFALTREAIDGAALAHQILRGEDGAFVNFEGVARNNTKGRPTRFLEYECYEGMAVNMMAQIGREIAGKFEIGRIAMVHRLGRIEIGETSVAVIVASPHRRAAFDAALEGINRLKKLVPVWKKEYFVDGEVWVDGEWDDSVVTART